MSDEALEYDRIEEALLAYPALLLAIVSVLLTSVHCFKFYQDFYTKDRASVQHRRTKPNMDTHYKRSNYVTLATLILCTIFLVFQAIQYNFMITGDCGAGVVTILTAVGLYGAKGGLYTTYVFRLHQVYRHSAYRYSPHKLVAVGSVALAVSMVLFVALTLGSFVAPVIYDDTDGVFPWFCQILMKDPYQAIIGGVMVLFDVTAAVMSIIGFAHPLKKLNSTVERTDSAKNEAVTNATGTRAKILYSGYKYKVLVIAASSSTILWILLVLCGLQSVGFVVMLLDYVINPVCLLLMSSYYPNSVYYERLCYLCICCCGQRRMQMEEHLHQQGDIDSARSKVKSVDVSTIGANQSEVQSGVDVSVANV